MLSIFRTKEWQLQNKLFPVTYTSVEVCFTQRVSVSVKTCTMKHRTTCVWAYDGPRTFETGIFLLAKFLRTVISADTAAKQIKKEECTVHTLKHKFERNVRHEFQKLYHGFPDANPLLTASAGTNEIKRAINKIKQGKFAGTDGTYPEMIKNLGDKVLAWLAAAMSDIIKTSRYSESGKHRKMIAILKPKKPADNPCNYRPLFLLSCLYKLFERIILFRIGPIIDQMLLMEQAGNRHQTRQRSYWTTLGANFFHRSWLWKTT